MSFGVSTGDFRAGVTLIKELISALRGSAELEYRELELELHGLQRALDELEHLQPGPGQEIAVNSVKAAALLCRYPLEEFRANIKRYQLLSKLGHPKKLDAVEGWARKVQWNVSMPDEVQKLRAYIAAHIGSLNMRLLTLGLTTLTMAKKEASERDCLLQNGLKSQMALVTENSAKVETLYSLVTSQVVPQLQNLIGLAGKVWTTNLQIITFFSNLQNSQTRIDTRHTWFQEPLRFDDAFGRTIPFPVEYGWSIGAIIRDQFSSGPGKEKVFAGEYEIFNTEDSSILITPQNFSLLQPGAAITMAMVIGRYEKGEKDQCPKPGCKSKMHVKSNAGGFICVECNTWFGKAQTPLPALFRLLSPEISEITDFGDHELRIAKKRMRSTGTLHTDVFKKMREERKWFKNLRIHLTDLSSAAHILDNGMGSKTRPGRAEVREPTTISGTDQEYKGAEICRGNLLTSLYCDSSTSKVWNGTWDMARKIIIEEMELAEEDLTDDFDFFSGGMDSLRELIVLDRLNEELELHLKGWEFTRYPNVREMRKFLEGLQPSQKTPCTRPETQSALQQKDSFDGNETTQEPTGLAICSDMNYGDSWTAVIEIMARDLYLDPNELLEAHSLLELGMDSMYLAHLAGMIKEEFGVEISVSRMFSFRTLSELRKFVHDGLRGM